MTAHFVREIIRNKLEFILVQKNTSRLCKIRSTKALKLPALPFSPYFVAISPIDTPDEKALVVV